MSFRRLVRRCVDSRHCRGVSAVVFVAPSVDEAFDLAVSERRCGAGKRRARKCQSQTAVLCSTLTSPDFWLPHVSLCERTCRRNVISEVFIEDDCHAAIV